jgi:hypothetical protein
MNKLYEFGSQFSIEEIVEDPYPIIERVISKLDTKDRLKLFRLLNEEFCFSCGYEQPFEKRCQCWNDE